MSTEGTQKLRNLMKSCHITKENENPDQKLPHSALLRESVTPHGKLVGCFFEELSSWPLPVARLAMVWHATNSWQHYPVASVGPLCQLPACSCVTVSALEIRSVILAAKLQPFG